MPRSAMMTVRIEPELLEALRAKAVRENRSVSAEVVSLIREHVQVPAKAKLRKDAVTSGMFPDFEAPSLDEFRQLRTMASAALNVSQAEPKDL